MTKNNFEDEMGEIRKSYELSQQKRKNVAVDILKIKLSTYRKRAEDLETRIPKFSEKDIVWISDHEQGIVKKVKGEWDSKANKVKTKYYVLIFSKKKKKILVLDEKQISKDPEYFKTDKE